MNLSPPSRPLLVFDLSRPASEEKHIWNSLQKIIGGFCSQSHSGLTAKAMIASDLSQMNELE